MTRQEKSQLGKPVRNLNLAITRIKAFMEQKQVQSKERDLVKDEEVVELKDDPSYILETETKSLHTLGCAYFHRY